jgi:hypothetical protein
MVPRAYMYTVWPPLSKPAGVRSRAPSGVQASLRKKLGRSSFSYMRTAFSPSGGVNVVFLDTRAGGLVAL